MKTLIFNFLYHFRIYLLVGVCVLVVLTGFFVRNNEAKKALQKKAALRKEEEQLREKESKRLLYEKVENDKLQAMERDRLAKLQTEENNRLAKLQAEENKVRVAELEAAQLKAYKSRYVNEPGNHRAVALFVTDGKSMSRSLSQALSGYLKTNGVSVTDSLLTIDFLSDGLFATAFSGSKKPVEKLDLARFSDALLFGYQTVEYSTNSPLENVVTARTKLELMYLPLKGEGLTQTYTIESIGVGLGRQTDARAQAEERMIKKIHDPSQPFLSGVISAIQKPQ